MKEKILSFAATALIAYFPAAFAGNPIVNANRQISLEAGVNKVRYTEMDSGTIPDTETGNQFTKQLHFSTQTDLGNLTDMYFAAEVSRASGSTDYVGHYLISGAPLTSTTDVDFSNASLKVGTGLLSDKGDAQVTPYVQYLYRKWDRRLSGTQQENYKHQALGVGMRIQYAASSRFVLTGDLSWANMFDATIDIETAGYSPVSLDLGKKSISNFGLSADYAYSKHIHFNAKYKLDYFDYGQSNMGSLGGLTIYEPHSHTTQQALYVGVGYTF